MPDIVVENGTGLTTANSYVSVDDASIYFEARLNATTWTGASNTNKEIALQMATRLLDELVAWDGYKYDETNALMWPRGSTVDRAGYAIDVDEMPQFLLDVTAEFAMWLLASDRTAEDDTLGFRKLKAGSLEMEINRWDRKALMPDVVWNMVRFCATKTTSKARFLVRG